MLSSDGNKKSFIATRPGHLKVYNSPICTNYDSCTITLVSFIKKYLGVTAYCIQIIILDIKRSLVRAALDTLKCALEQDTLSSVFSTLARYN